MTRNTEQGASASVGPNPQQIGAISPSPSTGLPPASTKVEEPPPLKILVVDDDQYINRLVQIRLKNAGYAAGSAVNGAEAIAMIRADAPDLIFLDVSMPEIDGLEVLKTIRAENFDIAVIMMTAFGSESIAVEALRLGADDYLRKPFEPAEFQAVFSRTTKRLILARQNAYLQARLEEEIARAGQVQLDLLPNTKLNIPGFRCGAHFQSARAVSGDFYDWYLGGDGVPVLTLGDVMGKGLPAALLMATVRATLRGAGRTQSPGGAMAIAAAALESDLERTESFVTLFHARLDPTECELVYANAGHGMGFVLRADGTHQSIETHNLPLGVFAQHTFTETRVALSPGDALYIYTDGLLDAPGALDVEQLITLARSVGNVEEGIRQMVEQAIAGAEELPDDLTLLAIERVG